MADKKYRMGTLASEERRYPDAITCLIAARLFFNGDFPSSDGKLVEPPQIEPPHTLPPPPLPKYNIVYSWRSPGTDVEMRFIVDSVLEKEIIIYYYRINRLKNENQYDEDELNAAIAIGELGENGSVLQAATRDNTAVAVLKALIWRATVKKNIPFTDPTDPTFLTIGFTSNPPYPP